MIIIIIIIKVLNQVIITTLFKVQLEILWDTTVCHIGTFLSLGQYCTIL
jgi:hypothetical protein